MKRCKKPTEPGYYLCSLRGTRTAAKIWRDKASGMLHLMFLDFTGKHVLLELATVWWGPKISELDPK